LTPSDDERRSSEGPSWQRGYVISQEFHAVVI
jgi:hypothetical protein